MSVTWLHISDFHVRSGDSYDRDVVLQALVASAAEYRKLGHAVPDVVFATGDVADSGKSAEYELAERFFDDLLNVLDLDKSRLFVVPGNHDVDRDLGVGLARTLESREEADKFFNPDHPKPQLTAKLGAFLKWHNRYFEGTRTLTEKSTCGPAQLLEINGRRLGILPINSSLFCQDENDHHKLWIGRRCLDLATADLKKIGAEVNIALIHHPLDWLSPIEGSNIQAELDNSVHILLRGHLHDTKIESVASTEGELFRCAAGAAYQTRKWPNRALYGTLDGNSVTVYPIRYEDAPRPVWTTDPSVFPRDPSHKRAFPLPEKMLSPATSQHLGRKARAVPGERAGISNKQARKFPKKTSSLGFSFSSLSDYVSVLEADFAFRWERGRSEAAAEDQTTVYWPVRLRRPTPIHVIQTYAACGLLRCNFKVVLFLDDLGNVNCTVEDFERVVRGWLKKVYHGTPALEIRTFSELMTEERARSAWELMRDWFVKQGYNLNDILSITKLWPRGGDAAAFAKLLEKKPRPLLTPPLVWTGLVQIVSENTDKRIITLGGYDERPLWDAWRECAPFTPPVGHLYAPQLTEPDDGNQDRAVHMARPGTHIDWSSKEDIRLALEEAANRSLWNSPGRLLPWSLNGCARLPRLLSGTVDSIDLGGTHIASPGDLDTVSDPRAIVESLTDLIAHWYF